MLYMVEFAICDPVGRSIDPFTVFDAISYELETV
jgi:hypothetical protein